MICRVYLGKKRSSFLLLCSYVYVCLFCFLFFYAVVCFSENHHTYSDSRGIREVLRYFGNQWAAGLGQRLVSGSTSCYGCYVRKTKIVGRKTRKKTQKNGCTQLILG